MRRPAKERPVPLRPPARVMRLSVLGAFRRTRLSFMPALLRMLKQERWRFARTRWNINQCGEGIAVYEASGPHRKYSLAVFAHDIPPSQRTDRVIAGAWDATFTLYDGVPSEADLRRMRREVSLQENGRNSGRQIVLSRANRSVRAFDATVGALAAGRQPEHEAAETGYLMRTTAVYGNGKFGIADRADIAARPEFTPPFAAEMLAVFMFRAFPADLVNHLAGCRNHGAAKLLPRLRRMLGIGNSTGLGMAPFLVNHPILLHHWIVARETALARVRSLPAAGSRARSMFLRLVSESQMQGMGDVMRFCERRGALDRPRPWDSVYRKAEAVAPRESVEQIVSFLLEPHGAHVDDLCAHMACDESFALDGGETTSQMLKSVRKCYRWALRGNPAAPGGSARFWYASAEKQEPRLGRRGRDSGAAKELPLAIARDIRRLYAALAEAKGDMPLADFLLRNPQHRGMTRRVQIAEKFPYAEIRDNLVSEDMLPLDMLRCKLSFFGAEEFDPRSDRWVRVNMFRNAPCPYDLGAAGARAA